MKRGKRSKRGDRATRKDLPPIPSGTEVLDMVWRELTPHAATLFETLPKGANPWWATTNGLFLFSISILVRDRARREYDRTPVQSVLWRWRKRELRQLEARCYDVSGNILAALHDAVCEVWPRARPEQVLLLIQERFRTLNKQLASEIVADEFVFELALEE